MGYILIADDDVDDILLLTSAFEEVKEITEIKSVTNGKEALEFLYNANILPSIIILDLNMPLKGGISTLQEIRNDALLKVIPVIIFSTSGYDRDIMSAYACGANSYIRKPMSYDEMRSITQSIREYWFNTVILGNNFYRN